MGNNHASSLSALYDVSGMVDDVGHLHGLPRSCGGIVLGLVHHVQLRFLERADDLLFDLVARFHEDFLCFLERLTDLDALVTLLRDRVSLRMWLLFAFG